MTPGVKDVPRTPGVLIAAEGDARATILGLLVGGEGGDDAESSPASVAAVATGLTAATGVTAAAGAAAAAMATAAAAAALAVATVASAGATAALATATRAAEAMPPSPGAAIAAAVARGARSSLSRLPDGGRLRRRNKDRTQRRHAVSASDWAGDQSCVLSVGRMIHLSTFDAQGLADILNSREASTERMAGTKVRYTRTGIVVIMGGFCVLCVGHGAFRPSLFCALPLLFACGVLYAACWELI